MSETVTPAAGVQYESDLDLIALLKAELAARLWTVTDRRDLMDASPAGPPARPGVSVRYDQEALVFWVVFALVLGALVLGFCFGFAARDLRREALARRRADEKRTDL